MRIILKQKKTYPNWITTKKVSDVDAKYMAFKWIKTILKPEYLPDDLFDHLILLDGAENKADIVCVRYRTDIGYEIQIVQTNTELFIVFGQPDALGRDDFVKNMGSDTASSLVEDIVSNLFDKSEAISVMHSLSEIKSTDGFYYFHQKWSSNTRGSNQWWGNVSWWTDGITVAFYIPKFYGGSLIPFGLTEDWF